MKALIIYDARDFKLEENWPQPQVKPGWALIKVQYAGICGSDIVRFGKTGSYHHPMILGHEFAGIIEKPAPGSKKYKSGDRVAVLPIIPCGKCSGCDNGEPFHCTNYLFLGSRIDGGFAEYCLVPEENIFSLPQGLDLRTGAFIEPLVVALHVVRRSGFRAGQSALIFGAGAIGILIGLWLKVFGASRIAIADIRAESLAIAKEMGFPEIFNPEASGRSNTGVEEIFDAAFEAAGSSAALRAAIERTKNKGTITIVGRDSADTIIPLQSFECIMRKELDVHGCWGYNMKGEQPFVYEMLKRGSFHVTPMITHEIPLSDAPRLIRLMIDREIFYCKVLLKL